MTVGVIPLAKSYQIAGREAQTLRQCCLAWFLTMSSPGNGESGEFIPEFINRQPRGQQQPGGRHLLKSFRFSSFCQAEAQLREIRSLIDPLFSSLQTSGTGRDQADGL